MAKTSLACLLLAGATSASAAPVVWPVRIASESFAYAASAGQPELLAKVSSNRSEKGWSGAWSGLHLFRAEGLQFPGVETAGGSLTLRTFSANSFRDLDVMRVPGGLARDGKLGVNGTELWLRFLAERLPDDKAGKGHAGLSLFDGEEEQLFIGKRYGLDTWGFERGDQMGTNSTRMCSQPSLVVVRLQFKPGQDKASLWVFREVPPAGARLLPDPDLVATFSSIRFDRIRISGGQDKAYAFDELVLATT